MKRLLLVSLLFALLFGSPAIAGDCFVQGRVDQIGGDPNSTSSAAVINNQIWVVAEDNREDFLEYFSVGDYVKICRQWGSLVLKNRMNGISAVVHPSVEREPARVDRSNDPLVVCRIGGKMHFLPKSDCQLRRGSSD